MAAQIWNGKVFNRSDKWVICLWDGEENGVKVWKGKALGPGRRSPFFLDVDGVKAADAGVSIGGWQEWWWLNRGAEASIKTDGGSLTIKDLTLTGNLSKVTTAEVDGWGPSIDLSRDVSWGDKLIL
jgi:hypothetical protein